MNTHLDDAFMSLRDPDTGKFLAAFWSCDWFSLKPWTYGGGEISYICKQVHEEHFATMTSYFIGPLCIIVYKNKQ